MIDKKELVNYLMNWRASLGKTFQDDVISIVLDIILKKVESFDCNEKLKELEDLEEQGLLLRLPCKVGDSLYRPLLCLDDVVRVREIIVEVVSVYFEDDKLSNYVVGHVAGTNIGQDANFSDIGKTVFLTKAEAEKALAEMKGE